MRRCLPPILALACALVVAVPAQGASSTRLYDDCQDNGVIDGTYTQAEYQKALAGLPSDLDQYTDCRDLLRRAQLAAAGRRPAGGSGSGSAGGGAGGSGGGSAGGGTGGRVDPLATATPQERQGLADATAGGQRGVDLAGALVTPGRPARRRRPAHPAAGPAHRPRRRGAQAAAAGSPGRVSAHAASADARPRPAAPGSGRGR